MALTDETKEGLRKTAEALGDLIAALPYPFCKTAGTLVKTLAPGLIVKAAEIAHLDQYITVTAKGGTFTVTPKPAEEKKEG
jgi:hypothetical protein